MRYLLYFCLFFFLSACASFKAPYIPASEEALMCKPTIYDLRTGTTELHPVLDKPLDGGEPLLFLSGGSQKGAFGAGFLAGWKKTQGLPEFAVVTGVSTGSLQGVYAFTGDTDILADEYAINDESRILKTYIKDSKLGLSDYLTIMRKGSVADLSGLHNLIVENLKKDDFYLIQKINERYVDNTDIAPSDENLPNALFLVIATSVDDGSAKVFDMTELSNRIWRTKENPEQANIYVKCFADILTASSAVPMAAQPVFIDNKMYVDGGLKFSVSNHQVSIGNKLFIPEDTRERDVYVVLNGTPGISDDCAICGNEEGSDRHKNWSFFNLAQRSISIVTDQVDQFSLAKIASDITLEREKTSSADLCIFLDDQDLTKLNDQGKTEMRVSEFCQGRKNDKPEIQSKFPRFFYIKKKDLEDPEFGNCTAVLEKEKKEKDIVEFHPDYMKCLIKYGQKRASTIKF